MRKTRRVHIAAKLFILAFSVYAAFTLVSLQLQIREKEKKMAVLQAAIDQQELENRQIQDILDNADDTEYIAEIAREKLGYVAPGERVFVDISSK
ncbi:MAG: septum formation initiator family protein [Clostridia bacterium]|nr:septum formation initiator family protein [Clostridia bacterium]MBQ3092490.1 septum formation initiator family protein [Clostridia bacterium]MBQ9926329.1 septum formation initiator family protein [Clostridia bacterium]